MKDSEWIKTDYITFNRVYCKSGFIDKWMGDCFIDPNHPSKNQLSGNVITTYYRMGGQWLQKHEFDPHFFHHLLELREEFTAEEIWNTYRIATNQH